MARPSTYEPQEDAIILAHAGHPASETNAALQAAGYDPRSPDQIKQRRHRLQRQAERDDDNVSSLMRKHEQLRGRLEGLESERQRLRTELRSTALAIRDRLDQLDTIYADELSGLDGGDGVG